MKIHRFIGDFDLSKKELEIAGEEAQQMIKVLKLKAGEKIDLSDGKGTSAIAHITEIAGKKLKAEIEQVETAKEPNKQISLYCAVLKKENFELVVQKATECGVSKIIPIITSRTIKTGLNTERLRKIAKEASEQSGRNTIPEINEIENFEPKKHQKENNYIFDISGEKINNFEKENINIWIGPEGGWTDEEIRVCQAHNFKIASLGTLTLRGETAAIISTYLVSNF